MVKASTQYKRENKPDYGHEKIEILYEDEWLVIINKPTGMLSVPYPGSRAQTALDILTDIMKKKGTVNSKHHPFTVHRLDRDTSGVMMFALNEQAQQKIMNSWHQMVTERLYHAVAENPHDLHRILPDSGWIDSPLAFNAHNIGFVPHEGDHPAAKTIRRTSRKDRKDESVYERNIEGSGKNCHFKTVPARTWFRVVLRGKTHTLFELSLDTGKKNQIRAHLADKGYPLAGDENYRAHTDPFHRLALHARTLEFIHPYTGKTMKFEIPEPGDWAPYVEKGDMHPIEPVWGNTLHQRFPKNSRELPNSRSGSKKNDTSDIPRISSKKRAHMNYIERGKLFNR